MLGKLSTQLTQSTHLTQCTYPFISLDQALKPPYSTPAMKDTITLTVTKRPPEDKSNVLRKQGEVPGVMYGNKMPNTSIKCSAKDLRPVFRKAGASTLVEVHLEDKKIPVLIHSVTFDPVTDAFQHIDLYAVDMTREVTAQVPLAFTGESLAVKDLSGILVTVHHTVTVTCLPKDLPHEITLDISTLANFRDTITVGQLVLPQGVTVEEAKDVVLVTVQEPRKEEVVEAVTPVEGEAGAAAATADGTAAPAAEAAAPAGDAKAGKKEEKKK